MSLPNTPVPIESLPSPFVSKSEPIAHVVVDSDHFIVAGRNGTVTTGSDIEGCVSHPITSLSVQGAVRSVTRDTAEEPEIQHESKVQHESEPVWCRESVHILVRWRWLTTRVHRLNVCVFTAKSFDR